MKKLGLICLTLMMLSNISLAQKGGKSKSIDSLTQKMVKDEGIITTYFNDENKLYFEIGESAIGKDMLMVTRIAQIPANYSPYRNAGSKTSETLIHFEKKGKQIRIRQISFTNLAEESDPILQSVQENNYAPIIAAFDIMNDEEDRFLVDVSGFFMNDSPSFNIIDSRTKDSYKIGGVDKKRSSIDAAKSFPQNVEVLHTLTFPARQAPRSNRTGTFTFQVNHSMILLPEDKMQVRYGDERVGWFSMSKINYSSDALKADDYSIIRRWRLEPKNPEAYMRGELTEPVKPIIYYLDPATPIKWRPYFKKGIEDWNIAFEKAGFKNAIIAKDPPTKEEDPDFSPEDVRYSTVRYVASTTRNAVGPSVSDPRTGEIIESDIIWYHNHLRSYRNRYLLETGAANPSARTLDTPEEEIGEMMRRVIAHEIGHAIGLPHNMKASSAYPVDSLRSGSFTQRMGIAATIMDYARYNYIAQPGDENIRFVRQMGPYDDYAVEWGYRWFDKTPEEEKSQLKTFVDERSLDPVYMFGSGGGDPNSQTENIGDDPIKASNYGLSNLKIVASNLEDWTISDGDTYNDLEELYGEMLGVYRRYVFHVLNLVGGVYETRRNKGQDGISYQNVSPARQKAAMTFLNKNMWATQHWLMEPSVVSNFSREGSMARVSNLQNSGLNYLLSPNRLNRMVSAGSSLVNQGLNVDELMKILVSDMIVNNSNPDVLQRTLQKNLLMKLNSLEKEKDLSPEVKGIVYEHKEHLKNVYKKKIKGSESVLKAHYMYCFDLLSGE